MAKTLIGNIKGKNGRGITSIKKTGTTGSVDTYTITYTDSTTSTFTVNNSDSIALQRQIVPSAAIESSATASQAYAAGDYVVVNGVLRKVTAAIAKGNAISDSNSAATTVSGELATLGDSVSRMQTRLGDGLMCYVEGGVCVIAADYLTVSQKAAVVRLGSLPDGLRPLGHIDAEAAADEDVAYIGTLRFRGENSLYGQIMVTNSGTINAYVNDNNNGSYFFGQLVFPVTRS
jgi:hypothetical protein